MGRLVGSEQIADLDKQDAAEVAAGEIAEAAAEPAVEAEAPTTEEGATSEPGDADAPKETVQYAEEVEVVEAAPEEGGEPATPEPLSFGDDSVFTDPLNPEATVTGKELKERMLMQSDYTRKTQELAEQRKEMDARLSAIEAKGAPKEKAPEPIDPLADYDQDDPLVQQARKLERQVQEMSEAMGSTQKAMRSLQESDNAKALQATEASILETHANLTDKDLDTAAAIVYSNRQNGVDMDYATVCKDISEERAQLEVAAVRKWKTDHKIVNKPKSDGGAAPDASPGPKYKLGNRSIIETLEDQDRQERLANK